MKIIILALAVMMAATLTAQQPVQNPPRPAPAVGKGSISGVVVTDDAARTPIRRATVTLRTTDETYGATAVSDDSGRFAFLNLAAGRYNLGATKAGFVSVRYGAKKPGRPGTPLALADGQALNLPIALLHGAAISGTIRMPSGEPATEVGIEVQSIVRTSSGVHLQDVSRGWARTDDRGVYRVFGLPPGDYAVKAQPANYVHSSSGEARLTTASDVLAARGQGPGGGSAPASPLPRGTTVGYVSVFYPGTPRVADAKTVTVAAGEERLGVDITLQMVNTSSVSGTVVGPDGATLTVPVRIVMAPSESEAFSFEDLKEAGGSTFRFGGLRPGRYTIVAQQQLTPGLPREEVAAVGAAGGFAVAGGGFGAAPEAGSPKAVALWASVEVSLSGQDEEGLTLRMQPSLTVKGRLTIDTGARQTPPDFADALVRLYPAHTSGVAIAPPPASVSPDGSFAVVGVIPGSYRLWVSTDDQGAPGGTEWFVKSAQWRGQNITDLPFEITVRDDAAISATLTDRGAVITGTLQDPSGRPAPDYFIVVFPTNAKLWSDETRLLQAVRPGTDGRFDVRHLPAGEYYLAALTDVEPDEWKMAAFLEQVIPGAIKLTVAEGETKRQDVRIGGEPLHRAAGQSRKK